MQESSSAIDRAKGFLYAAVLLYFIVKFGQNIFSFGSSIRKDFYFIGMDIVSALFALSIFKLYKSKITMFWLWFCISAAANQIIFKGNITYLEIIIGIIAVTINIIRSK